ncbi:nucleolar protein 16 [Rhinatrema bivittatum]|uniref:nucleolar protein 16 n=1 Tax=Rhinatrema bivittatum TaxID=194408 RepID=UPI00112E6120|nr:nucleolar protein 16 [Rhinatrema bivittatum]
MPKAKGKNRRKRFNYNLDRKKLKRKMKKKDAPRIACEQIRNAWDDSKSVARNLAEMGLAVDPNKAFPIQQAKTDIHQGYHIGSHCNANRRLGRRFTSNRVTEMDVDPTEDHSLIIQKPYVLEGLQAEASLPEKSSRGISSDMVEYVRYMVEKHGKNYKAMARDERNYYQDTPKQIQKKIRLYQHYHPDHFEALSASGPHGDGMQQ